ncbi:LytTR family DNA-binding domain-containing protein [Arenicella sp. 4NH20-0111]|uniref:LytR/AlgR family response regulator transcription factor n=1 Tax=Arenicella sp. 4NH20-0111 TaxID=3127648 RepID=UPI003101D16C
MNRLKHFQKFQTPYMIGAFTLFFFANALTLATSRIMEEAASGSKEYPFETWEPFLWEFSSAIMILILIPLVNWLLNSTWLSWANLIKTIIVLFIGSLVFSVLHVAGMVLIRETVYWLAGSDYRFGAIGFGFLYEYRKDLLTFAVLVSAIQCYRFIVSRVGGEANLIGYSDEKPTITDRILVKKLGKEFIVKIADVDWLESSGNYVNLHVGKSIYPTRNTMSALIPTLVEHGFCRIQRSYGVNLDRVESIEVLDHGGGSLTLVNGKTLPISRRYRDELKLKLDP